MLISHKRMSRLLIDQRAILLKFKNHWARKEVKPVLLQSAILSHLLGAEVCVAPGAVPVPGNRFGVKGRNQTEILTHAVQNEPGHPQVIPHVDAFAGPHLELPLGPSTGGGIINTRVAEGRRGILQATHLSRHDFGVSATDVDPGVQTCSVVSLRDVSSVSLVCPHAAVIRP